MVLSAEQERVRSLIADTVSLLCKNGLHYTKEFSIEGLLGITLDCDEVFLVNIKEIVKSAELNKDDSDSGSASEEMGPNTKSPSARRRRRKRNLKNTSEGHDRESDSDNETNSSHAHANRGEPPSKNIKQENDDSSDDLVFVKNEPGSGSNNFGANLSAMSGGANSATNDILGDLSQHGQLYATPTSNPLPGPSWDPHNSSNSSLYNTLPPNQLHQQQGMNVMSPSLSPGSSMQQQQMQCGVKMIRCKLCPAEFRSVRGYQIHSKTQHAGIYTYHCPYCLKGLTATRQAKLHLKRHHTGVEAYLCVYCRHEAHSIKALTQHLLTCDARLQQS